jgi:2-polyprenyl-3-methyl-5-hydroxy-6-metoxy-1,4-benzoquinol methylase
MWELDIVQKQELFARYSGKFQVDTLSYGTVRDYCDSCDHLPWLSSLQHDLKDLQRPWTVKAVLGVVAPGARLLEIGAGQPIVAALLAELGYSVTVVDPYDGSGGGPTKFNDFVRVYPTVRIVRAQFQPDLPELKSQRFDAIYSISVLEHILEPTLQRLFEAISRHLEPGGQSFHSVDCVTDGNGAAYHFEQCLRIANYQRQLAGKSSMEAKVLAKVLETAGQDVETFYLSAAGHNLWRSNTPYEAFPFRKVLSFQTMEHRSEYVWKSGPIHAGKLQTT